MRYVIIGNSAAGNAAACSILTRDPSGQVLILSDEPYASYYRPLMPFFIDDRVGYSGLFWDPASLPRGESLVGVRVVEIDPSKKLLCTDGGAKFPYDRLLIATGGSPVRLCVPGAGCPGVYVLRSMADAAAIKKAAEGSKRVVIIGGGRVGTKAAMALSRRSLEVTVVEQGDRIVPFQFDQTAATMLTEALEAQGIRVVQNGMASVLERREDRLEAVTLKDGRTFQADFVVMSVGIRPNSALARDASIEVDQGIVVNKHLRTSAPDIFAAGDVAQTNDIITGESMVPASWTSAVEMGRIAGHNMAGGEQEYPGTLTVLNSFVLAGIPTVSVGLIQPPDPENYHVVAEKSAGCYRKLVLKDGRLVGALMVGDIEVAGLCTSLVKRGDRLNDPFLEQLMAGGAAHAAWLTRSARSHQAMHGSGLS